MAFDEELAHRVRALLAERDGFSEKKMFGGMCYLINGNMCCGVVRRDLMIRVGPDAYRAALDEPHARPMDFTGRPMKGMVYVGPAGLASDDDLATWVDRGARFAAALEPK